MKYYIIQKVGYEYNDEVYYRAEDGGGTPEYVFLDKDKAQKSCDEKNIKELSGLNIFEYGYSSDEIFEDEAADLMKKFGAPIDDCDRDYQFPSLTLKQYRQIEPYLKIKFYEVCEVSGE